MLHFESIDTVIAENPGVQRQLLSALIWAIRCGEFGPDVNTLHSRMIMHGALSISTALLELAGDKEWVLRGALLARYERLVLNQAADEAMLTRAAEDAQESTGLAPVARHRTRL
ncbi:MULTISPECIES: hypothetical protein [Burkholderiaceae]|uniref:hypothetical protein n=1 Tax=Burkholderiaceae TaxID=119060 RepID=UPI00161A0D62|nr:MULTISPECIES: hypothetical protein [Burkholderiaceae]MBB2981623.1 tRNA A-37 threonylcarbamoyl transferase component Bud32 [Paraburkholderia tropica]